MVKDRHIPYERFDEKPKPWSPHLDRHQICVPSEKFKAWDVICHYGSYGYEEGLLEIYGDIVPEDAGDSVQGWLTADDVIKLVEEWREKHPCPIARRNGESL